MGKRIYSTSNAIEQQEPIQKNRMLNVNVHNARRNIAQMLTDSGIKGIKKIDLPYADNEFLGKYGFLIWKDGACIEISVPGLPLSQVRQDNYNETDEALLVFVGANSMHWDKAVQLVKETFAQKI